MNITLPVAVVGATGLVGEAILTQLHALGYREVYALASQASVGKTIDLDEASFTVQWGEGFDFNQVRVVIIAAGSSVATTLVPRALKAGCWVIDKSSAHRLDAGVPLVIPSVNAHALEACQGPSLIASPNCTVTPLVMALKPLLDLQALQSVHVATYQSVSGSGRQGMQALFEQSCAHLNTKAIPESDLYDDPIALIVCQALGSRCQWLHR